MVTQGSGDFGKSWLWMLHGTCVGRMPECFLVWGGRSRRRTGAVRTVMAVSICFARSCTWQLHGVLESLVTKRTITHYNGCINAIIYYRQAKSLLARASVPSAGRVIADCMIRRKRKKCWSCGSAGLFRKCSIWPACGINVILVLARFWLFGSFLK
jgi:hypothetical protein